MSKCDGDVDRGTSIFNMSEHMKLFVIKAVARNCCAASLLHDSRSAIHLTLRHMQSVWRILESTCCRLTLSSQPYTTREAFFRLLYFVFAAACVSDSDYLVVAIGQCTRAGNWQSVYGPAGQLGKTALGDLRLQHERQANARAESRQGSQVLLVVISRPFGFGLSLLATSPLSLLATLGFEWCGVVANYLSLSLSPNHCHSGHCH